MKTKISIVLSVFLAGSVLCAQSMEEYMQVIVSNSPAQSYRTENVIGYSGGDLKMRWGASGDIKMPISVSAPRLNVGCGGIDAELGGFAYLKDKMVQMFQNISAAAPAFAFQLALKTLCSQCSATLQELQNIADQINSMSLNGCAVSNSMLSLVTAKDQQDGIGDNGNTQQQGYISQYFGNGNGGNLISDYLGKAKNILAGKGIADPQKPITKLQGSWLEKSLDKNSKDSLDAMLDGKALPLMRAMVGDVYGYMGENGIMYKSIDPIWSANEVRRFVGIDSDGATELKVIAITNPIQDKDAYDAPIVNTGSAINFAGLKNIFKPRITNILVALGQPGATLNADDISFISKLPVPIYKVLNNEIIAKGYGNADIDTLSEYIATQQALAILELVVGSAQKYIASFKLENGIWVGSGDSGSDSGSPIDGGILQQNFFSTINSNVANIRGVLNEQYKRSAEIFVAKREQQLKIRDIERQLRAAISKTSLYNKSTLTAF